MLQRNDENGFTDSLDTHLPLFSCLLHSLCTKDLMRIICWTGIALLIHLSLSLSWLSQRSTGYRERERQNWERISLTLSHRHLYAILNERKVKTCQVKSSLSSDTGESCSPWFPLWNCRHSLSFATRATNIHPSFHVTQSVCSRIISPLWRLPLCLAGEMLIHTTNESHTWW